MATTKLANHVKRRGVAIESPVVEATKARKARKTNVNAVRRGGAPRGHLVPQHRDLTVCPYPGAKSGNLAGSTSMAMDRAAAGRREINPAFSSVKIIWCTVGGVTRKKRAMSDCAGGRPFTNV